MARLVRPIDSRGAVVNVLIGQTRTRSEGRKRKRFPRIDPLVIAALVDTGASISAIDPSVVHALQLPPVDVSEVHSHTAGDAVSLRKLYEISLAFTEPEAKILAEFMTVVGCDPLAANGYLMLIGRDILDRCEFRYDGPKGEFTLTF